MGIDFNKKLGLRIRELRVASGMKQGELADLLNMERSNLTRIENGKQRPNDENLEKIASILNVEIKELYDFGHVTKSKEEIINCINDILPKLNKEKVVYIYRTVKYIRELL